MKKIITGLVSILLLATSNFSQANVTTLDGWTISDLTAEHAKTRINAEKTIGEMTKKSHALIAPTVKDVGKVLVRGAGGFALSIAVQELLGAVDWVMDPANNQIRYKVINYDQQYRYKNNEVYQYIGIEYVFSIADAEKAFKQFFSKIDRTYVFAGCDINPNLGNRIDCKWGFPNEIADRVVPFSPSINPDYGEKILPIETVAAKVISNAESDNADAQVVTTAAAQDILNEAEHDTEKAKPIVEELEANSTGGDPNNPPDPDDEKPVNDGKQAKKMNEKQVGELVGNKKWHDSKLKGNIVKAYTKQLRGSNNFDFYKDPKTGEIFIKGNKSKEMILINLERFL